MTATTKRMCAGTCAHGVKCDAAHGHNGAHTVHCGPCKRAAKQPVDAQPNPADDGPPEP